METWGRKGPNTGRASEAGGGLARVQRLVFKALKGGHCGWCAAPATPGGKGCRQLTEGVLVRKPDRKSGKDFKQESDIAPLTF